MRSVLLAILLSLTTPLILTAQNNNDTTDKEEIFDVVEIIPEFPGGEDKLWLFLDKNLVYPLKARDKNITGKVYVGFIVEKDGNITHIEILKGIGYGCDEEVLRVI